jgi:AAA domain
VTADTSLEPYHEFGEKKKFEVIADNIGATSWSEWLKWYDEQELVYAEEGDLSFDDLDTFDLTAGEDILLGNGLLCSGEAIGLYGDSGIGKSVLVKQWAVCAAAGMPFFRIPTSKPCKVLIFQGENGNRAEAEAIQGIRSAMTANGTLTTERLELVRKNFTVISAIGYKGSKFMGLLRRKVRQYKPDLVFIDPLLGVADGNLSSQEYMSNLLRENIIPMAREFNVGIVVVHHSGKSGAGTKDRSLDDVKNGALGSMDFGASLRAVIGLFPKTADGSTYELVTTKRGGSYLGRKDDEGNAIDSDRFNIRHSRDGVVWIAMDKIAEAANTQDLELDAAMPKVEEFIRSRGSVKVAELKKFAKDERLSSADLAVVAATRLSEAKPEEFHCYQLVSTGSPRVWSTSPEPEENRKKREVKVQAKKT